MPKTSAEIRQRQRESMRALRREREFVEFCRVAGIGISPQSSLNSALFTERMDSMVRTRGMRVKMTLDYLS